MIASSAAKNVKRNVSRGQSRSPMASIILAQIQTARIAKVTRASIVTLLLGSLPRNPWSEFSMKSGCLLLTTVLFEALLATL